MRACAERVAPEIGVVAWVVDDTGIVKDGKHSPGVKRQYSGTLGKVGNCQITVSVHAVGERGHAAAGLAAVPARGVVRRSRAAAEGEDPGRGLLRRPSRSLPPSCASRRPAGRCRRRRSWPTSAYGDDAASAPTCTRRGSSTCVAVRRRNERLRAGDDLRGARAQRHVGRPRTVARPDRKPESVRTLAAAAAGGGVEDAALPDDAGGRGGRSRFAFVRVVATHPVRNDHPPPRWEWLIIEWPEGDEAPSDYWLSNLAEDKPARAARPARPAALDDRARLPPAQRRTRARPLRGPQLPRLPPPHALVTCAHAFLTEERLAREPRGRPDAAAGGAAPAARPALLDRPLPNLPTTRRPRPAHPLPPTRVTKSY